VEVLVELIDDSTSMVDGALVVVRQVEDDERSSGYEFSDAAWHFRVTFLGRCLV
jgi:hypothetical protein